MKNLPKVNLISKICEKKIKEKKIIYDHSVDQTQNKWDSDVTLSKVELSEMPDYLRENYKNYVKWLEV